MADLNYFYLFLILFIMLLAYGYLYYRLVIYKKVKDEHKQD